MRSKLRWRFYCDFCKKAGGVKRHMETHEKHCTNNPDRVCRVHNSIIEIECQPTMDELKAAYQGGYPKLREVAHNCPACILAVMRQSFVMPESGEPWPIEPNDGRCEFDFKKEMAALMADFREMKDSEMREIIGPVYWN